MNDSGITEGPESANALFKRVLVIHHDKEIRHQLEEGLQKSGWEVFLAEGRTDGLPVMYEAQPELIFLGVVGEREEGWETFRCIRLLTDKPVILLADNLPLPNSQLEYDYNALVLLGPILIPAAIAFAQTVAATFGGSA